MEKDFEILELNESIRCFLCSELANIVVAGVPYCDVQSKGGCCEDIKVA